MSATWGFDIGGANLKFFDSAKNHASSIPFRLWERPHELAQFLRANFNLSQPTSIAIAMTGELCDCFASKQDGVCRIADSVCNAFGTERVYFYGLDKRGSVFFTATEVATNWPGIAAANWHATASWLARLFASHFLETFFLVDIGSTTTDIIPVQAGSPKTVGTDDFGRTKNFELLYTGVARTPVFGVLPQCQLGNKGLTLATEWFASMRDVYLLTDDVSESADDVATCDGRPATRANAIRRLARLLCLDEDPSVALEIAKQAAEAQSSLIHNALKQVVERFENVEPRFLVVGEGAWLAKRIIESAWSQSSIVNVDERLGADKSKSIAAVAVAELLQEQLREQTT